MNLEPSEDQSVPLWVAFQITQAMARMMIQRSTAQIRSNARGAG